jgi:dynein heavy chain
VDNKTEDVEQLISSIQEKQQLAEKSSQEASRKQIAAEEQGKTIKIEKDKADAALMEALPAVEAAAEALNNIRREDLQELKAFNNPPVHVKIVCQICTILRPTGEKLDETWGDSKKMLGNAKLLDLLKDYPKESLTEKMYQRCKKILRENKKHEMTIENMSTKSQAGKGLLVWVLAILRYYEVARNVIPLKDRVKEMQKAQAKTERELNELTCLLKTLDAELHDLRKKYDGAKNELSELQLQAAQMQRRLVSASSLIDGLKGEQHRWKIDKGTLEKDYSLTTGNSLLFAAFQSYFGAFNDEFRQNLIKQVMNDLQSRHLSYNEEFKPEDLLLSKLELQTWVGKGLSKDSYSIQNGLLTMLGSRFPLCIDPQEQAFEWIKKCFESSQLIVKSMEDRDYIKHLELAIEFGNPFIFQNVVEDLDPILENVLNRTFILENGKKKVMIGDKAIEWDDNFRLYLCTKMNNPSYTPEIMSKINIVNYSVTRDGLADQLLNIVINNERPVCEAIGITVK